MFSQSMERESILSKFETENLEPKVVDFSDLKNYLQSLDYTQEEIDRVVMEVSHTMPMLDMARKNSGNQEQITIEDVRVEIDIANKRVTKVNDSKRKEDSEE